MVITITRTAGANAVLNGLFLDPTLIAAGSAGDRHASSSRTRRRKGNWIGAYGAQGYDIDRQPASLPAYATVTPSGQSTYTWTDDHRPTPAPCRTPAGQPHRRLLVLRHQLHRQREPGRRPDARPGAVLPRLGQHGPGRAGADQRRRHGGGAGHRDDLVVHRGASTWTGRSAGNVVITITRQAGANAVLNGLFLDSATPPTPTATLPQAGHDDAGELDRHLRRAGLRRHRRRGQPAQLRHRHALGTVELHLDRELDRPARPPGSPAAPDRIAACWYSTTSFTVDVNLTDGQTHDLELYFLDWDNNGPERAGADQRRRDGDGAGHRDDLVVHQGRLPGLGGQREHGDHDHAAAGANAVLSGLFLDPVLADAASDGLVHQAGHDDAGELDRDLRLPGLRRHRQRGQPAQLRHRHARGTVELHLGREHDRPAGLQDAGGSGRIAACWYSPTSFTVDVNLTDGQTHDLELYFLDWDTHRP